MALVLLALPAFSALAAQEESEALVQGASYRSGTTDYYVVTDPGTRTYTDYTIPSAYIYIDCPSVLPRAFADCTKLQQVIFSSQVKTVGDEAFRGCTKLYSVECRQVETVGDYVFAESTIASVSFSGKLTSLGSHAFDGCSRLVNFPTWNTALTEFKDYTFRGTSLTAIDLRGIETLSSTALDGLTIRAQVVNDDQIVTLPGMTTVHIGEANYINSVSATASDISIGVKTSGHRAMVQDPNGNDVAIRESINPPWYSFVIPDYEVGSTYIVLPLAATITFPSSMGLEPVILSAGDGTAELPDPEIDGMAGWTVDGTSSFWSLTESEAFAIGKSIRLKAMIEGLVETYDHSAVSGRTDVSALDTGTEFMPGDVLASLPDVTGYEFVGWEIGGVEYEAGDEIPTLGSHTAKSLWTATVTYTVSYPALELEDEVEYGAPYNVTSLLVDEEEPKRFIGWAEDGSTTVFAPGSPVDVDGDMTVFPVFEDRALFTVRLVDGDEVVAETAVYDGRTYTLTASDPEKEFSVFQHWELCGQPYARADSFTVTADSTLNAVWVTLPTSTVTYHIGSGDVSFRYCTGNAVVIYCEVQPPTGMVLSGWSTDEEADAASFASGETCTLSDDLHLYPVWAEGERATLSFHGTTSGDVSMRLIPGTCIEVDKRADAPEHWTFAGWSPSPESSSAEYVCGSEMVVSGDIDLYPVFVEDQRFTVTYLTGSERTGYTVYIGTVVAVGTGEEPVRDGFRFSGWRDAASSAVYGDDVSLAVTEDLVLVAEWEELRSEPVHETPSQEASSQETPSTQSEEPSTEEPSQTSTTPSMDTPTTPRTEPAQRESYSSTTVVESPPVFNVSVKESSGSSSGLTAAIAAVVAAAIAVSAGFAFVFLRKSRWGLQTS